MKLSMSRKYPKGFTLLELLVVLGLMVMIFTVAVPNYRNFQRGKVLDKAYQDYISDIRMAQQYAIAGTKPSNCGTAALQRYEVVYSTSSRYYLRAVCGATITIKTVNLTNVTQSWFPNTSTIIFKVLGEGTNLSGNKVITLTLSGTATTKTVTITPGGEVY